MFPERKFTFRFANGEISYKRSKIGWLLYKLCLFLGNAERAKFRINNIDNSNNFLTYCTYGKVSKDLSVSHVDNNISTYLLLYQLFSSLCTDKEIHGLDQLYRSFLCNCWSYWYSRCLLLLDSWLILFKTGVFLSKAN